MVSSQKFIAPLIAIQQINLQI